MFLLKFAIVVIFVSIFYQFYFPGIQRVENKETNLEIRQKLKKNSKNPIKVGVIGSGIGGSSFSYFLNEFIENGVKISIFEKQKQVAIWKWKSTNKQK